MLANAIYEFGKSNQQLDSAMNNLGNVVMSLPSTKEYEQLKCQYLRIQQACDALAASNERLMTGISRALF